MSIGPPALGNILVQRLDAVLGTTMAAHANLISGARPDAVTQPGESARPDGTENATRGPRQGVDTVDGAGNGRQNAITDAKTAAALALAARGLVTRSDLTASAPTTLGMTARTILTLLALFPEKAPPIAGRAPLWTPAAGDDASPDSPSGPRTGAPATATGGGNAGQASAGASTGGATPASAQAPQTGTASQAQAGTASQTQTGTASQAQAGTARPAQAPAAGETAPVAPRADTPPPAALAQALRSVLQNSGLFYESHLTQMAYGQRTPGQLAAEPQAGMRMPPGQADAAASAARQAMTDALAPRDTAQQPSSTSSATVSLSGGGQPSSPAQALASIHPDATLLVRQQLDVLANQSVAWQGQPWPDTEMEWEVERDRTAGGTEIEDGHWATRIKLDLPRLGLVEARINLVDNQLMMHLAAPRSAAELSRHGDGLRQRMTAAGLTLTQLNVDVLPPSPFVIEP
ncbi:Flagellar hook-length control protein FliK [Bordetella ansorpii]|uniref:Flagellar hook-length control protein FliK n=1 Tax=Bordetella ansorpii TaxID=288768 RepID=A0A157SL62_9BORD|nr:flagellar hook-length control protein FliK [Bordetella ansorpii]SAI71208.1 Flagellar hook-length control protein FliK [Bordetella ansorpii]